MNSNLTVNYAPAFSHLLAVALAALVLDLPCSLQPANAQTIHDVYDFSASSPGDGALAAGLALDREGNLYGTTVSGGSYAVGTVFKITPSGTESVLYDFGSHGGIEGFTPEADLLLEDRDNLYGTTVQSRDGSTLGGYFGSVFKIDASGHETVLHSFDCEDGAGPLAGLVKDREGNLYGTTQHGGSLCNQESDFGLGEVFKLSPSGHLTILHSFVGGPDDGEFPDGPLLLDDDGNLYGTAVAGGLGIGNNNVPDGFGVIFKIDRSGKETILHRFTSIDGSRPYDRMIRDWAGNLYGVTVSGGAQSASGEVGAGTVFKLDRDGKLSVLHSFGISLDDGVDPQGLAMDWGGNLFGTTAAGGTAGKGTLFEIDREGKETVLYNFGTDTSHPALATPLGNLIMDWRGDIYGSCLGSNPDDNAGAVYRFSIDPHRDHDDGKDH